MYYKIALIQVFIIKSSLILFLYRASIFTWQFFMGSKESEAVCFYISYQLPATGSLSASNFGSGNDGNNGNERAGKARSFIS